MNPTTKTCTKCGKEKPHSAYNKWKGGLRPHCRACQAEYNKLWRSKKANTIAVDEKACRDCGVVKPISEFHRNSNAKDGCQSYCKDCASVHSQLRWADDRSRRIAYQQHKRWRAKHRERRLAEIAEWRKANRDRVKQYQIEYRPKSAAFQSKRRALKFQRSHEDVDFDVIYERDKGICHLCHKRVAREDCHFDHVIPLARGGSHTYDNIKVAHSWCNLSKGAKLLCELANLNTVIPLDNGQLRMM